jgi:uridine kinase
MPGAFSIGIDGMAGSGKTTLSRQLELMCIQAELGVCVVSLDRLYWQGTGFKAARSSRAVNANREGAFVGEDYDWRRLEADVLLPARTVTVCSHTREHAVVIVEGPFCLRNELHTYYDLRIVCWAPRMVCLERAVKRDGESSRSDYEEYWRYEEDAYVASHNPIARADLVVDGRTNATSGQVALAWTTPFIQRFIAGHN